MGQFFTLAKFSAFAAVALLSPVFAFLIAVAAEILFGVVADASALPLVAFIAIGAVGCSRLRKWRALPRGRAPIVT
jgi:O-antigen ligase